MSYIDNSAGLKIGVLTFDVKNAFNSASWEKILIAAEYKGISSPILRVLYDYFSDRSLLLAVNNDHTSVTPVTSGVPQGSVLGPTLWNIMYDGLLREQLPTGVDFLAYADDVALVVRGKDVCVLERLLTAGADVVVKWMADTGLELAIQKSESMIITNTRTRNDLRVIIGGTTIKPATNLKYLGIHLDPKLNFTSHALHVAAKAGKVASNLVRILPNISEAKQRKRRLLSGVVHSILLYGAPVWSGRMSQFGLKELGKCQRRIALRVASAYCSVSEDAALIIADIPPIDLLAAERSDAFNHRHSGTQCVSDRGKILDAWQSRWEASTKGRWTFLLIPDLRPWFRRNFGETTFHLTQALSGHGCFAHYLHRIGKLGSPACWYCQTPNDDAFHTLFMCDAWHGRRAERYHGMRYQPTKPRSRHAPLEGKLDCRQPIYHGYHEEEGNRREAPPSESELTRLS